LWEGTTDKGLPRRPGTPVASVLRLPAPSGTNAASLLKAYILALESQAPPRASDGRDLSSFAWSEPPFLREASLASKSIIPLPEEYGAIQWTTEEAKQLYGKLTSWWPDYKRAAKRARESGSSGAAASARNAASMGHFLARVVLPPRASPVTDAEAVFVWLQEMRDVAMYPTVALPYLLLHCPNKSGAVEDTIADDLASDGPEAVAAAAEALRHWAHLTAACGIAALPSRLLTLLLNRIAFRLVHGIRACLVQVSWLLQERPELFTLSHGELLAASLTAWNQATLLSAHQSPNMGFDDIDRPELRALVAGLSSTLANWYEVSHQEVPEPREIALWRDLCARDPLPEVRRAFGFGN
jgi:hypothetical protein